MSRFISREATAFCVAAVLLGSAGIAALGIAALLTTGSGGPADCPKTGDVCADGTLYAGVSPNTNRNVFVTPKGAAGTMKWEAAMKFAAGLDAHGHKDWTLPTRAELDVLYQNRDKGALKGTFDTSGSWYWSAPENPETPDDAWVERFSDGLRGWHWKDNDASVRPVRSEPRP